MRTFKTLLAAWFALSTSHAFEAAALNSDPQEALLLRSVRFYNSFKSVGHMVNMMKAHASDSDKAYLDKILTADDLKQAPPEATLKETRMIFIKGLKKPIEIHNLASGEYSYEGRNFQVDYTGGLEKSIGAMEGALFPKPVAFFNWILPEANAVSESQKKMLTMTMGLMGIMGLIACFSAMASGKGQQAMTPPPAPAPQYVQTPTGIQQVPQQPQMSSCGMALFGLLGMMMAMGIDADKKPEEIRCLVDLNGNRSMTVYNGAGAPLSAPYVYTGTPPNVQNVSYPPQTYPPAMAQMTQFCANPQALMAANQAMRAPYTIPPHTIYANPSFPVQPGTVKTMSVDKDRQPANGEAHYMPPGTAGSK